MEKAEQKEWNLWEIYDDTQLQELEKLNEAYKAFLDAGKTERECVTEIVRQAEAAGYRDLYSMDAVKAGGDRQELHEKIRQHSMAAGRVVKEEGKPNDLLERIAADPSFGMTMDQLKAIMKPENFVGRAPQQVEEFVEEVIQPILDANKELLGVKAEINV